MGIMANSFEEIDPAFAKICSDATLQSNPKGFFKSFAEGVCEVATKDNWLDKTFKEKETDADRLKAVLNNNEVMEVINQTLDYIQPVYRCKDAVVSCERRIAAIKALQTDDKHKALALSSQAVIRAPPTGVNELVDSGLSLAFALWVRSEVLLRMEKFDLALSDLKIALKERLPAKQRSDYYWRMGNCYRGLKEVAKANVSYDLALRLIGNDSAKCAALEADIKQLEHLPSSPPQDIEKKRGSKDILLTQGSKQNMPSLSRLIKVIEDHDKGRFAVAANDIRTGDILLVDQPYASCLLPEYFGSHCLNCFQRFIAPLWCPTCSAVAFCSAECQNEAVSTYHKYECNFIDLFIGSGMSILSHIALRMVTQLGIDAALTIHSKYFSEERKVVDGSLVNDIEGAFKASKLKSRKERMTRGKKRSNNNSEKFNTNEDIEKIPPARDWEYDASQIYTLCTHFSMRTSEDYLKRLIMAMFLMACLKRTSFFESKQETKEEAEQAIVEIIIRNLQMLQFNAHEIYETVRSDKHKFNGAKSLYVAVAIYPTGALFNHECYPAVTRYFDGKRIILRATRPLKANEMIAENYGPQFLVKTKAERQRSLACRYWFRCSCKACIEDWPTLKQLSKDEKPRLRCLNDKCGGSIRASGNHDKPKWPERCYKCNTNLNCFEMDSRWQEALKCIKDYQRAAALMEEQLETDAAEVLRDAIDSFHSLCSLPHRETHIAQEALRSCYADGGNIHIVEQN